MISPLRKAWVVTFSGLGINLALGGLYTWSVIANTLSRPAVEGGRYLWTAQQANLPYAFAVGCFALAMTFAGRLQDRYGARWVATAGGAFVGLGMIIASLSPVHLPSASAFPVPMVLGFGVLGGIGIGFAYSATTPAAVKWFSARKRGLITGIVISGFGLAPLVTTAITTLLVTALPVNRAFLSMGVFVFAMTVGLGQLVEDPPKGYVPPGSYTEDRPEGGPSESDHQYTWQETLRTPSFYVLWLLFGCSTVAGLMVIGALENIASLQLGERTAASMGYLPIAALALGNGVGRPIAGAFSDMVGRRWTMLSVLAVQAVLMIGLGFATTPTVLVLFALLIGVVYGALLTLVPATTFDFFGIKNAGVNYGLVFTAWGVGGVLGSSAAARAFDRTAGSAANGSYATAFAIAAALTLVAAGLTILLKPPGIHAASRSA